MLERIIISLLTAVGSRLLTWVLEKNSKKAQTPINEAIIDERLKAVKDSYVEGFDGKPITKEQREKINKAISNFIRSSAGRGL